MAHDKFLKRPNVIPWPPILLLIFVGLGAWATYRWPMAGPAAPWKDVWFYGGLAMAGVIILIYIWAERTMHLAGTNVMPHQPATELVTHGPFKYSRNPIYVANILLMLSGAVIFMTPWLVLFAAINAIFLQHLAIKREEKHLEARFGDAWRAYRTVTPRWIGPF